MGKEEDHKTRQNFSQSETLKWMKLVKRVDGKWLT